MNIKKYFDDTQNYHRKRRLESGDFPPSNPSTKTAPTHALFNMFLQIYFSPADSL